MLLFLLGKAQGVFEANSGQWEDAFLYRLRLNSGSIFIEKDAIRFNLLPLDEHALHHTEKVNGHSFKLQFIGSQTSEIKESKPLFHKVNYLLGSDPERWRSNQTVYEELSLIEIYPGIDLVLNTTEEGFKFNFILKPGADIEQIRYFYEGLNSISVEKKALVLQTSVGSLKEYIPKSWQGEETKENEIEVNYTLSGDTVGFASKALNPSKPTTIDPILVFSTFSGSQADNWGFTATYSSTGEVYGGGIAFGIGYPTTIGAYQTSMSGSATDIAISKLSADGSNLIYATYLGGTLKDQPHSLIEDQQGNLVILGISGSLDFPVTANAYQSTFGGGQTYIPGNFTGGTDIIISKLSPDGSQLLASTYYGGNLNDGLNSEMAVNYADEFRGGVQIGLNNEIIIASVTQSSNISHINAFQSAFGGWSDAIIAKFQPNLSGILWSTYYGGGVSDCANGLEISYQGELFVVGGTRSSNLRVSANSHQSALSGNSDGYILRMDLNSGAFLSATYIGTSARDQVYLVEADRYNHIYVFGQTFGNMPVSPGVFSQAPGGQFIQQYTADLQTLNWSTVIGNGVTVPNMSPTAFLVDDCLNIYLSGWGGVTNSNNLGLMDGMPITADAFKDVSDGSDFYFMALTPNATNLLFGSYYGGEANEHVDAGTSRFSPDGTIYQAVCAGCGQQTFPTTPGVYGPNSLSSNCNLGLIKIDFDFSLSADALIDIAFQSDTICDTINMRFLNSSINANRFFWDFGNGQTSNDENPIAQYDTLGTYRIRLIVEDTLCNLTDSAFLSFTHTLGSKSISQFEPLAVSCNPDWPVQFVNNSLNANDFLWDFGDGTSTRGFQPAHIYGQFGTFKVTLTARDSVCNTVDTSSQRILLEPLLFNPMVKVNEPSCKNPGVLLELLNVSDSAKIFWDYGDGDSSQAPIRHFHEFPNDGFYTIKVAIFDTVCGSGFITDTTLYIEQIVRRLYIPNAFTPNGDKRNEVLIVAGDQCLEDGVFSIFNRWGELIFQTNRPFEEFWDGSLRDEFSYQGVYYWVFRSSDLEEYGSVIILQ